MYIIVDVANLWWRCVSSMATSGLSQGAEYAFLRATFSLKSRYPSAEIVLAGDTWCDWRREIFPEYKGSSVMEPDPVKEEMV